MLPSQMEETFDKCLQSLPLEQVEANPDVTRGQEASQASHQEEDLVLDTGDTILRVPGYALKCRRYRCFVPGGQYNLRWNRERILTSLIYKPAPASPPAPTMPAPTQPAKDVTAAKPAQRNKSYARKKRGPRKAVPTTSRATTKRTGIQRGISPRLVVLLTKMAVDMAIGIYMRIMHAQRAPASNCK